MLLEKCYHAFSNVIDFLKSANVLYFNTSVSLFADVLDSSLAFRIRSLKDIATSSSYLSRE